MKRALLTQKNSSVDDINDILMEKFPADLVTYKSTDRTINSIHQIDYEDFLKTLQLTGFPPHKLNLKKNCPVMLLRNINPIEGVRNGMGK